MKILKFLFCFGLFGALLAQAAKDEPAALVGTWAWHHLRHEMVVNYRPDGTYERKSSSVANGREINSQQGTWRLRGNILIEIPSETNSAQISSVVEFQGKNRFLLNGFMTFERVD